jgi:hypothetical protein
MNECELYPVWHHNFFCWKWRHQNSDGQLVESEREFRHYYDCVEDARAHGYRPEIRCR